MEIVSIGDILKKRLFLTCQMSSPECKGPYMKLKRKRISLVRGQHRQSEQKLYTAPKMKTHNPSRIAWSHVFASNKLEGFKQGASSRSCISFE